MNKTQKGFALVEGLLIVLILTIIGFGGYYVWNAQRKTNESNSNAIKSSQSTASSSNKSNESTNLVTIKSSDGFSFSYPKAWDITAYGPDESVNGGIVEANNPQAIVWRVTKTPTSHTSVNDMCVDISVTSVNNVGVGFSDQNQGTVVATPAPGLAIWRLNKDPYSDDPIALLEDLGSNYLKLPNGKALLARASFTCGQGMTTNLSYDQQLNNADYKTGVSILESVKLN